jgi:hypothetical protein
MSGKQSRFRLSRSDLFHITSIFLACYPSKLSMASCVGWVDQLIACLITAHAPWFVA